jgi:hypothetical protein
LPSSVTEIVAFRFFICYLQANFLSKLPKPKALKVEKTEDIKIETPSENANTETAGVGIDEDIASKQDPERTSEDGHDEL